MTTSGGPIGNSPSTPLPHHPIDSATAEVAVGQNEVGVKAKLQLNTPKDADLAALLARAGIGGVAGGGGEGGSTGGEGGGGDGGRGGGDEGGG